MRSFTIYLFLMGVLLVHASAELQHRQQENFQYSSSSKKIVNGKVVDENDKSGFHRAQTGNMGGNYEESENMDAEARRKMDEMLRLSREGIAAHGFGAAPALGPMGIPVFMTGASGQHRQLQSSALTTGGLLMEDCDTVGTAGSSVHQNAASSQYARTGTLLTPVQPIVHRSESASHYSARSESGGRVAPITTVQYVMPVSSASLLEADSDRYRDSNRRTVYTPVVTPVGAVHSTQESQQAGYVASESRRYPVYQPAVHHTDAQAQASSYSSSQVEPQRTYPVTYTGGAISSGAQHERSSQFHQQERRYDSTHDELNRGTAYIAPAQTEIRQSDSQRYGNRNYEHSTYPQVAVTTRPQYIRKAEIDRHFENLDRTVESLQRGRTVDRNSIVTPRPVVVDVDYDDSQQQVQQSSVASSSAYAAQQNSRDILSGASVHGAGYVAGSSRNHQQGYSASAGYDANSRYGMLQSGSSVVERADHPQRSYQQVDQRAVDRSAYAAGGSSSTRRGNAEELGQEASDLLGISGAAVPGGSYRQESGDSTSYGYHKTGTFGEGHANGVRGTYARDGNVAATSSKTEDMHQENGRVKFSAQSSHSKHEEHSERRSYDLPAGTAANQVSQAEIDSMSPEQRRAYWQQFGRRFDDFASKLYNQHGY